ncbi:hypothetical protein BOTBODRAFT_512760 [Botryobasidium botryosum FD-172 SS1]|uniref:Uncharacterized protein n=1 Tax=Botryobasidium botryosum (strain FD-172 SS1) TaxID=930990 RepID=A0A067MSA1_BOTB1|nr:hypothetical protein BOTBODRAFT_512760 [Botryobasidium botryosum FD-172 SS1]
MATGESKNALFRRVGAILWQDYYFLDPTLVTTRVKNKHDSLVKQYKEEVILLVRPPDGTGDAQSQSQPQQPPQPSHQGSVEPSQAGDDENVEEIRPAYYIPADGPQDDTPEQAKRIWDEIVDRFEFFPRMHHLLAGRSNIVSTCLISGSSNLSTSGAEAPYGQSPMKELSAPPSRIDDPPPQFTVQDGFSRAGSSAMEQIPRLESSESPIPMSMGSVAAPPILSTPPPPPHPMSASPNLGIGYSYHTMLPQALQLQHQHQPPQPPQTQLPLPLHPHPHSHLQPQIVLPPHSPRRSRSPSSRPVPAPARPRSGVSVSTRNVSTPVPGSSANRNRPLPSELESERDATPTPTPTPGPSSIPRIPSVPSIPNGGKKRPRARSRPRRGTGIPANRDKIAESQSRSLEEALVKALLYVAFVLPPFPNIPVALKPASLRFRSARSH